MAARTITYLNTRTHYNFGPGYALRLGPVRLGAGAMFAYTTGSLSETDATATAVLNSYMDLKTRSFFNYTLGVVDYQVSRLRDRTPVALPVLGTPPVAPPVPGTLPVELWLQGSWQLDRARLHAPLERLAVWPYVLCQLTVAQPLAGTVNWRVVPATESVVWLSEPPEL